MQKNITTNETQSSQNDRIVEGSEKPSDVILETSLRPKKLSEYIGQSKIKENLNIFIQAAKQRKETIEHVLLYGPPGLGKTTLAHIIAHEMNTNIKVTSGPAIEKSGDLAAILTNLQYGDILFIDEIHRLNKTIEEILYPAMEDFALDIIIGQGPSARTLQIKLSPFTIIGATTKFGQISSPLRDRFGNTYHMDFYTEDEISKIINRSSKILKIQNNSESENEIAKRSRKTPRVANRLLKRVRDFAQVKANGTITKDVVKDALKMLGVDELGLESTDRKILDLIIDKFKGGPVGLSTISAASAEEIDTIEDVYEPYLIQLGFLNRTPRGRVATPLAYKHLNKKIL